VLQLASRFSCLPSFLPFYQSITAPFSSSSLSIYLSRFVIIDFFLILLTVTHHLFHFKFAFPALSLCLFFYITFLLFVEQDLEKLDEFKALNPSGDLLEGSEMIMSLKGDTMYYRTSFGGNGSITSAVFVQALNDVYFGKNAVSGPQRDMIAKNLASN
jgi:hypothetical protein